MILLPAQLDPQNAQYYYYLYTLIGCVVAALVLGTLLTYLVMRGRLLSQRERFDERERSLNKSIVDLEAASAKLENELTELRTTESILLRRQGELEENVKSGKAREAEQKQLLSNIEERFTNSFRSLSNEALKMSQEQFLTLAQQSLRTQQEEAQGIFDKRHVAVEQLIAPVAQSLEKVQNRVGEIEKARETAYTSLLEQVRHLAESQADLNKETHRLVKALRQPTGRGQWGEMQLQRCVEMAGMQEHCDFVTQTTTTDDEGKSLRPDLIVKLPGNQLVVVDSKAPMDAYLDAIEAEDDTTREEHLIRHSRQVAEHIRRLSSRNYQDQFPTSPEFVVLFLPSESFFSAALHNDPGLIEKGVDQGVILATPTTLIALLRAVSYGWRQEALAENARQISIIGNELYGRLTNLAGHFTKMGRSLDTTVKDYNRAMASFESRVIPGARKFEELGATSSSQSLPDVPRLESQPRLAAPGLETDLVEEPEEQEISPRKEDQFEGFTPLDEKDPRMEDDDDSSEPEAPVPDSSAKAIAAANDLRSALGE
ncbi:MAG: DNA recombination protein RmuC [Verrucomicrobiota bacterium JB023]|nr:DNA recombination protein RmuC [Verrucomicrobiota bacterium JB023]